MSNTIRWLSTATLLVAALAAVAQAQQESKKPKRRSRPMPEQRWLDPNKSEPAGTQYKTFHSQTIDGKVSYLLYLPPDYEKDVQQRFPVVYWLHGRDGQRCQEPFCTISRHRIHRKSLGADTHLALRVQTKFPAAESLLEHIC